ncbi:MAG: antitoxin MazE family protein [Saccharospirillum sp.]|nr:antitoxin MazE family protein [Saccharospirillum sp.]
MATTDINRRVQKHRDALRSAGLRPIQIWVPDTRKPGFADEIERQCKAVAEADKSDQDLLDFMDQALLDLDKDLEA